MPITIGSNISSIKAQGRLTSSTQGLSSTFERLSSGLRINNASDDAAGLSIAEDLKANERVYGQGIRNLNDGISFTNVVDSALQEIGNVVVRLRELASQSANGVYSQSQRIAIDKEARALDAEVTRIIKSTSFNGTQVLDGSLGTGIRLQGGFGSAQSTDISLGSLVGTGSFQAATTNNQNSLIYGTKLGDINGDGILDLIDATQFGIVTRIGNGDGTFSSGTTYLSGLWFNNFEVFDANNDGKLDILAGRVNGTGMYFLTGNGDGTFLAPTSFAVGGISTTSATFTIGDFNADGNMDYIFGAGNPGLTAGIANVFLGNGDGTFRHAGSQTFGIERPRTLIATDYDNDGKLDFVTTTDTNFILMHGNGDGSFSVSSTNLGFSVNDLNAKDLNGDGYDDMVFVENTVVYVAVNRGDGTFNPVVSYVTGLNGGANFSESLEIVDMNNDGKNDLVIGGRSNGTADAMVSIIFGNGNGTFRAFTSVIGASSGGDDYFGNLAVGDLNNDGAMDISGLRRV